jgi:purine-nucleoside phosphorylase
MFSQVKQTLEHLSELLGEFRPETGIVLGTGLGGLAEEIVVRLSIDYKDIPGFPVSTVKGHAGRLIIGELCGKKVIALQGRFHYYEGYSMQEVAFPLRVFIGLGIKRLFISNAAGGMNPDYKIGDLVMINDHINLLPVNPLIGPNTDEWGPRFPDMSEPYDRDLLQKGKAIADKHGIRNHFGVYAALTGPCFETPAEYRWLRTIGADMVGMSTVPEVIVARHAGIPVFAVSVVTDLGGFENLKKITLEEVLEAAGKAEKKLRTLFKELLEAS